MLTPNKEHRKLFPKTPVIGFLNGKSLEDLFGRAILRRLNESGWWCEPCGKKSCVVCDSISTAETFSTETCQENFKIQSGPLSCDLSRCETCGEAPFVSKINPKFRGKCNNYKSKHRALRKGNRKLLQKLFCTY